jgi:hypothetical protein
MNIKKLVVRSLVLGIIVFFGSPLIMLLNGHSILFFGSRVIINSLRYWVLVIMETVTLGLTLVWRKKL